MACLGLTFRQHVAQALPLLVLTRLRLSGARCCALLWHTGQPGVWLKTLAESIAGCLVHVLTSGPGQARFATFLSTNTIRTQSAHRRQADNTMVFLTMTSSVVEALKVLDEPTVASLSGDGDKEPSLAHSDHGNPISHGQIIKLWKHLKASGCQQYTLEGLLCGATVYIPPPPSKPEPVCQYPRPPAPPV